MYILDSLGINNNALPATKRFYWNAELYAGAYDIRKVIPNCNPQQLKSEITCNHWTFANIETLIKTLKSGKSIDNRDALDRILPTDINIVLNEQMNYFKEKTSQLSM